MMPWARWPSAGFVAIVAVYALVAAFFTWGFREPDLDRVWKLRHMLKIGKLAALDDEDRRLLERSISRHGALASALLEGKDVGLLSANEDGWLASPAATILRAGRSGEVLSILLDVQSPEYVFPLQIVVEGRGWRRKIDVEGRGTVRVDVPPLHGGPEVPEVIDLQIVGKRLRADPSVLGIRVRFEASRRRR